MDLKLIYEFLIVFLGHLCICNSVSEGSLPVCAQSSSCIIDAFLVSVFFKGVDDNVSSNVLRGQCFSCYSVGEGCFLACLEAHQLNVFKRTPSNISSNGRLLQMFFFFKCILLQTFFFFKCTFFRCSSTSNAPFFKCVPSSNALRQGQLNH